MFTETTVSTGHEVKAGDKPVVLGTIKMTTVAEVLVKNGGPEDRGDLRDMPSPLTGH